MRIAAFITIVLWCGPLALADEKLEELIVAVEEAEAQYRNLAFVLSTTYAISEDVEVGLNPQFEAALASETKLTVTLAGDRFRSREITTYHMLLDDGTTNAINVFDGQTHRYFWSHVSTDAGSGDELSSDSAGLVSDQPASSSNLHRPHMLLLESGCPIVHLSTYLKGVAAVLADPGHGYFPEGCEIEVEDLGYERFGGLRCRKILIDTVINDESYNGWLLWLAEDRNWIPARNVAYTYRWSEDVAVAESSVDEWKELRPGVWFPMKAQTDRYDSYAARDEGRQQLHWSKAYEFQSVSLEPETNAETFTELEFPEGTEVRVIEGGSELIR